MTAWHPRGMTVRGGRIGDVVGPLARLVHVKLVVLNVEPGVRRQILARLRRRAGGAELASKLLLALGERTPLAEAAHPMLSRQCDELVSGGGRIVGAKERLPVATGLPPQGVVTVQPDMVQGQPLATHSLK